MGSAARFWLHDLPPISGRLRLIFYAGLLYLSFVHGASPLRTISRLNVAEPVFYDARGLVSLFSVSPPPSELLAVLQTVTIIAWICAAIGLFFSVSSIVTAVGMLLLHGFAAGFHGASHMWYLPVYTLLFLCGSRADDSWSADYYLRRFLRRGELPAGQLRATGFSRKLVLLAAVALLFSGGVAKLLDAGPAWLDGETLRYHIANYRDRAAWPAASDWFLRHGWMITVLSILTLVLELGAPIALFARAARHFVLLAAVGFHLGIQALMEPRFGPHMWCYLLAVDWAVVWRWFHRKPTAPALSDAVVPARAVHIASVTSLGIAALFLVVAFVRIEAWPLSHMPMYSSYAGHGLVGGVPLASYGDENRARELAQRCEVTYCPWLIGRTLAGRTELWIAGRAATRLLQASDLGVPKDLWFERRRRLAIRELAAQDGAATRFLRELAPALRRRVPNPERYNRVVLTYRLTSRRLVLAEADL